MKTSTKWIIGIVIGLVVIASIVMIGYFVFNRGGIFGWAMLSREVRQWDDGRFMPMQPHLRVPGQRFTGFWPLRFIGGGLFFVGVLALIILGVIALIRMLQSPQKSTIAATPTSAPAAAAATEQTCGNCGRPVQDDWSHCPYCGEKLE